MKNWWWLFVLIPLFGFIWLIMFISRPLGVDWDRITYED